MKISKFIKDIVYGVCYGLRNLLNPLFSFEEISILAYHSISNMTLETAVTAQDFEKQLAYLKRKGFSFVSLDAIVAWLDGNQILHKAVAITFDDGYADFETTALPILEKYSAPVTLFIVGDGEASRKQLQNQLPLLSAEALKRIQQNSLVQIGYHTKTHANLAKLSGNALKEELISEHNYFAYPGGNYSNDAIAVIQALGYKAAFSIKRRLVKKNSNRYLLPRTVVTHTMQTWKVGVHTTKAIDWYRAVISWMR